MMLIGSPPRSDTIARAKPEGVMLGLDEASPKATPKLNKGKAEGEVCEVEGDKSKRPPGSSFLSLVLPSAEK